MAPQSEDLFASYEYLHLPPHGQSEHMITEQMGRRSLQHGQHEVTVGLAFLGPAHYGSCLSSQCHEAEEGNH